MTTVYSVIKAPFGIFFKGILFFIEAGVNKGS